jgi:hypothetical protein
VCATALSFDHAAATASSTAHGRQVHELRNIFTASPRRSSATAAFSRVRKSAGSGACVSSTMQGDS